MCSEDNIDTHACFARPRQTGDSIASLESLPSSSVQPSIESIAITVVFGMTRLEFKTLLADSWDRATGELLPLVFVPLFVGVLGFEELLQIMAYDGIHAGVRFAFPAMIVDVWTFVSAPTPDGGVHVSPFLPLFPVVLVIQGLLGAGLLGSIHQAQSSGEYRFLENVSRYGARLLLYTALVYALTVPLQFATLTNPDGAILLILLAIPVGLVLWYCFFATPYLVVVDDASLLEALGRSFELAVGDHTYREYAWKYLLFTAAVSVLTTIVAVNFWLVGLVAALVVTAPLALALNVATVRFVTDLVDDRSPPTV
ncbi:hypothetical protein OB955_07060 [Halobacteria archaeon AArc-m2/3/4]|uniref:Uncharacterized protein n=1 Tax=Natronoglomus mannanivorans TaxID=2979990 RepID=A0ABT2QC58_9EURY|nr:hypothetical protein [Halobacteria archaeon AArc-m2/3/4]